MEAKSLMPPMLDSPQTVQARRFGFRALRRDTPFLS